jgi:release factor glutamine methyltransferase
MTLIGDATAELAAAGVAAPRVDAELLLAHVLGIPRSRLLLAPEPGPADAERFVALVRRRAAREPLQHLTGTAPFRHLELAVGPGVFVPRPETELLADAVLGHLPGIVVDLCAGSGALALSIAQEAMGSTVYAVERSPRALAWLRRNAEGTGVTVLAGDVRDDGLLADLRGAVDVVVSNPPYVPASIAVDAEVRADPAEAVFAGADGLEVIPAVAARAADLLRAGGVLAIEHDDTQAQSVPALLRADGRWADIADHLDLSQRPRFVTARRCGGHR